jgi:hypothetical protein
VPASEKEGLAKFFQRVNADYARKATDAKYQQGEVKYGYLNFNCAKTIGSAFKYGAGYEKLNVKSPRLAFRKKAAAKANTPTDMAMKLFEEWNQRGYRMDAVLYRKYKGSTYVDPHEEEKIAFKDLPNRFPSVISLDFRNDEAHYEDYDNLLPMYLLHNMSRYTLRIDPSAERLEIEAVGTPMPYAEAMEAAKRDASSDSRNFLGRLLFKPKGRRIDEAPEGSS